MIIEFMLDRKRSNDEALTNAILGLSCAVDKLREQAHAEHNKHAILYRIEQKADTIMSAISDFAAKQKAFNDRQGAAIDSAVTSVTGLTADVAELNRLIKELQDSAGTVTPEDQATLDELQTQGEATAARAEAAATALANLDNQTPPVVPPTP